MSTEEKIRFRHGPESELQNIEKEPGTIYVTHEGNLYFDFYVDNVKKRISIKDSLISKDTELSDDIQALETKVEGLESNQNNYEAADTALKQEIQ